ncbi:MAG: LPS export ABC transporter periplasmic protein LptC, partial [Betaproteobacteria bacterium]
MATSPHWTRAEVQPGLSPPPRAAVAEPAVDRSRVVAEHWSIRTRDLLSTYLPLLLMLVLAALTWWLVRITPVPPAMRLTEPPSQSPDYVLGDVQLVRYRSDGSLMARIRARELRHYPVGDRVELDGAWVLADHPDGAVLAQAERAVLTEEGQRLHLQGDVRL